MTVGRAGHILTAPDDLDGARELLGVEALGSVTRRTLEARVAAGDFSGGTPRSSRLTRPCENLAESRNMARRSLLTSS